MGDCPYWQLADGSKHYSRVAEVQLPALRLGHTAPTDTANWLPAPAGSFYLILRMYCPRPEVRSWLIPPLQRIVV